MIRRALLAILLCAAPARADLAAYEAAVTADAPCAWYKLQETSGTTATDSGSSPVNGTYTGGFTLNQAGPATDVKSVTLNGTTGYVNINTTETANCRGYDGQSNHYWTFEAWVNPATTTRRTLAGRAGTGNWQYLFEQSQAADSKWYFSTYKADSTGCGNTGGVGAYSTGNWYHLVVQVLGGNGRVDEIKFYINGSLVLTKSTGFTTNCFNNSNASPRIGSVNADGFTNFFSGSVTMVAYYGNAAGTEPLSATRVLAHYNAMTATAGGGNHGMPFSAKLDPPVFGPIRERVPGWMLAAWVRP